MVSLSGETGIGKSRLATEIRRATASQGAWASAARCQADTTHLSFFPVEQLLRSLPMPDIQPMWKSEIARILPEILEDHQEVTPPSPMTEPWQRWRFLRALSLFVCWKSPAVLLIDDAQWCDADTLR